MTTLERFTAGCLEALGVLYDCARTGNDLDSRAAYREAIGGVLGMVSVLSIGGRMPEGRAACTVVRKAAGAISEAAMDSGDGPLDSYVESVGVALEVSSLAIFRPVVCSARGFSEAARALLGPGGDAGPEPERFESMPLSWLGCAYQRMLDYAPSQSGDRLEVSRSHRKGGGVYFTPDCLVEYITESVLSPLIESTSAWLSGSGAAPKILDPSMGAGDFLCRAVDFLCGRASGDLPGRERRGQIAANCVYGTDIDPVAVEVARFCIWAASGFVEGISDELASHLVRADALRGEDGAGFDWRQAFPEVFDRPPAGGFDAVVGNPPYIASKNGLGRFGKGVSRNNFEGNGAGSGQSDSYLRFMEAALDHSLVRPGGMFSMVLPDPMLVRGNAAGVRRAMMTRWSVDSLLHIHGLFPGANVANVAPVCRNSAAREETFRVARIERKKERAAFVEDPIAAALDMSRPVRRDMVRAQERCEFLYMLGEGSFASIVRRIHGQTGALHRYEPPFVPLREMNVKAIYRGEEIGKAAITMYSGEFAMLIGGQSIKPYRIDWEGRAIARSRIKKPLDRYLSTKILIQKSSGRLVAALDDVRGEHRGYIFPQSVYAVELDQPGISHLYLLCILNSELMNEYIRRTATGYKLLQPQIEIEDLWALPIRWVIATDPVRRKGRLREGIEIFEEERQRAFAGAAFPELANFVVNCLALEPGKIGCGPRSSCSPGRAVDGPGSLPRKMPRGPDSPRYGANQVRHRDRGLAALPRRAIGFKVQGSRLKVGRDLLCFGIEPTQPTLGP